jgi:hypothetical protein
MFVDIAKLLLEHAAKISIPFKKLREKRKYDYSSHDLEMLRFFYSCFDRAAFRDPFNVEIPDRMFRAIQDTIVALTIGARRTHDGALISQGKGKTEFESTELRTKFDAVVIRLNDIIKSMEIGIASGAIAIDRGRLVVRQTKIADYVDQTRNEVLSIVNEVFSRIGLKQFSPIPATRNWKSVHIPWLDKDAGAIKLSRREEEAIQDFFKRELGYMPPPPLSAVVEEPEPLPPPLSDGLRLAREAGLSASKWQGRSDRGVQVVPGLYKVNGICNLEGAIVSDGIKIDGSLKCSSSLIVFGDVETRSAWISGDAIVFGKWLCTKDMGTVKVGGFGVISEYRHVDAEMGWLGLEGTCMHGRAATQLLKTFVPLFQQHATANASELIVALHEALTKQKESFSKSEAR